MKKAIISGACILCTVYGHAQQSLTNSGNLRLHAGASLTGFGGFDNTSSGALVNDGTLYIKGNLSNSQASMAPGTGTLQLNGTGIQTVGGTQPFRVFNFVSANGVGITLNNDLYVSGVHTFNNGVITTSATPNYLVYEAGSSYSGDADTRHVNGWVKKKGNTAFVFPVGNGTAERTIAMHNLSATSEFNVRYRNSTTPNYNVFTLPVWNVAREEYWAMNRVSGGTAVITLNWDHSKVNFPNWIVPDMLVAGYNGASWTDQGGAGTASGNVTSTGSVSSGIVSSFNLFTFGSRTYILPLSLVSFTAAKRDDHTLVQWITSNESNTERFIVERSDNGVSFQPIGETPARNTGSAEHYDHRDYTPVRSVAYYRLRWYDIGGRYQLSPVVAVREEKEGSQLWLVTNPVNSRIDLMAGATLSGVFNYRITDAGGRLLQQGSLSIQNGGRYEIPLRDHSQGLYLLEVSNQAARFNYKVMIR